MNTALFYFSMFVLSIPTSGEKGPPVKEPNKSRTEESSAETTQDKTDNKDPADSLLHHRKAEAYFRNKQYEEAAREFLKAYENDARPAFLYLAGDAFERGGVPNSAIHNYKEYLKSGKNEARLKLTRNKLDLLKKKISEKNQKSEELETKDKTTHPSDLHKTSEKKNETTSGTQAPQGDDKKQKEKKEKKQAQRKIDKIKQPILGTEKEKKTPKRTRMELASWALVGTTAVLLTITGVFALKVEDSEDNMERLAKSVDPNDNLRAPYEGNYKKDFERYKREGELFEKLAWTFAGVSMATVACATVLFTLDYLNRRKKKKESMIKQSNLTFRPMISPNGGGGSIELRF